MTDVIHIAKQLHKAILHESSGRDLTDGKMECYATISTDIYKIIKDFMGAPKQLPTQEHIPWHMLSFDDGIMWVNVNDDVIKKINEQCKSSISGYVE